MSQLKIDGTFNSPQSLADFLDVLRPPAQMAVLDAVQMDAYTGDDVGGLHLVAPDPAATDGRGVAWESLAWALGFEPESCVLSWQELLNGVRTAANQLAAAHTTTDRAIAQIDAIRKAIPGQGAASAEQLVHIVSDLAANHDNAVASLRSLITERDGLRNDLDTAREQLEFAARDGAATVGRHAELRAELDEAIADRDRARHWAVELENQLRATDVLVEDLAPAAPALTADVVEAAAIADPEPAVAVESPAGAAAADDDGPPLSPPSLVQAWGRGYTGAADHARSRPGEWVCLGRAVPNASVIASAIRRSRYTELRPAEEFEAVARGEGGTFGTLWLRYIGPPAGVDGAGSVEGLVDAAIGEAVVPLPPVGLCVACRHRPSKHTADGCTAGECDCLEYTD